MIKQLFVAGIIVAFATPVLAADYKCQMTKRSSTWIPEEFRIVHDVTSGEVTVYDPVSNELMGRPAAGDVSVDNQKRITFTWEVTGDPGGNQQFGTTKYRGTIQKGSKRATVTATHIGFTNRDNGRGACSIS